MGSLRSLSAKEKRSEFKVYAESFSDTFFPVYGHDSRRFRCNLTLHPIKKPSIMIKILKFDRKVGWIILDNDDGSGNLTFTGKPDVSGKNILGTVDYGSGIVSYLVEDERLIGQEIVEVYYQV
jgi:hypothetical protein